MVERDFPKGEENAQFRVPDNQQIDIVSDSSVNSNITTDSVSEAVETPVTIVASLVHVFPAEARILPNPQQSEKDRMTEKRSKAVVRGHAKRINRIARKLYRKSMKEVLDEFASQGLTDAQTGEMLGVSKDTARDYYKRFEINRPSMGERTKIRKKAERRQHVSEKSRETALKQHREREEREIIRAFGLTEEEQIASLEKEYKEHGSLKKISISLRERGIALSDTALGKLRDRLKFIPSKREGFLPRRYGAISSPENKALVDEAIREGWLYLLTPNQLEVVNRRNPQEGEARTLEEVGRDMGGITRQAVSLLEKKALAVLRKYKSRIAINKSGGQRKEIDEDKMIALRMQGKSMQYIADQIDGVSAFIVRDRLIERGYHNPVARKSSKTASD